MTTTAAPGLRADWLNAWLAGIGITVLLPDIRLSWAHEPVPYACLHHGLPTDAALIAAITAALPSLEQIDDLVIARTRADTTTVVGGTVDSSTYRDRARLARHDGDPTLAACLTDLGQSGMDEAEHGPFDLPAPGKLTLWKGLRDCAGEMPNPAEAVRGALSGHGHRRKSNGLGFDYTRILAPTDPSGGKWVDPVIEILAFVGTTLLPVRGDGQRMTARGWRGRLEQPKKRRGSFSWPTWAEPLTAPGVDALLDQFWAEATGTSWPRCFELVHYQTRDKEQIYGYASRPLP